MRVGSPVDDGRLARRRGSARQATRVGSPGDEGRLARRRGSGSRCHILTTRRRRWCQRKRSACLPLLAPSPHPRKISTNDAKSLRDMAWKKDSRIRDAYLACESKGEHERLTTFLKLTYTSTRTGLHIILIAAEMAHQLQRLVV